MAKTAAQCIRQRKNGLYEGRIRERGENISIYGKTKKEVAERMEEIKYQIYHGTYCKPSDETVESWFGTWMETYKINTVKKSTIQTYNQVFDEFIRDAIGKKKLHDVSSQAIQRFINDLYKEGYSKSRVRMVYVILLGMFKQALINGMVIKNPLDAVKIPMYQKPRQEDRRVMAEEEQAIFLEAAKGSKYYDFYLMALTTGMRINEVLALRWSDIDFTKKLIHVNGTLFYQRGGDGRIIEPPKTESSRRSIPMLEVTEKMLHDRRKHQLECMMVLGADWKEEPYLDNMVMTHDEGGVFWDTDIRVDIKRIVKTLDDFEPITPHCFRHTFATRCVENGMPLQVLKTILGHSSLAMTADLYSHVLPDTKAEEMQKIANLF